MPSHNLTIEKILTAKEMNDFINTARSFCLFIETESSLSENDFLLITQQHLLTLYASVTQLPSFEMQNDKDFDAELTEERVRVVLKFISDRVPFTYYWTVLNPVDSNKLAEVGTGDLVDDLVDIYKDIKRGLLIFDEDDLGAKENAIWKFKFDFEFHWGEHCVEALYAIHHYIAGKK